MKKVCKVCKTVFRGIETRLIDANRGFQGLKMSFLLFCLFLGSSTTITANEPPIVDTVKFWLVNQISFHSELYLDASRGDFALGGSIPLVEYKFLSLNLGLIEHDTKIWGGNENWQMFIGGLAVDLKELKNSANLHWSPIIDIINPSVSIWVGKDFNTSRVGFGLSLRILNITF